ncbi:zinc finger protein-like, partial [Tropilaelaps mercedesae]
MINNDRNAYHYQPADLPIDKMLITPSIAESHRPRYQCSWCSYRAKQPGHLREHERTHTGERPFKCRFCPTTSKTASNIKVHERVHTNSKPYRCSECGICYRQSQSLREHQLRYHAHQLPEKPQQNQPIFRLESTQELAIKTPMAARSRRQPHRSMSALKGVQAREPDCSTSPEAAG